MPSLSDRPEIIGFFSYSREDDEGAKGALSALRDAIQRELSAQLGRSKAEFRLWQDAEAIAPGKLWESEISTAIEQSVFFIPIVTPRVVRSKYCKFEFEAFLARESELGRADLVFPILYMTVSALEDEAQWRNDQLLSTIGKRQYLDWRGYRHLDVHTPNVREAIERFCSKIVTALDAPGSAITAPVAAKSAGAVDAEPPQKVEAEWRAGEDARRQTEAAARRRQQAEERLAAKQRAREAAAAETERQRQAQQVAAEAEARRRREEDARHAADRRKAREAAEAERRKLADEVEHDKAAGAPEVSRRARLMQSIASPWLEAVVATLCVAILLLAGTTKGLSSWGFYAGFVVPYAVAGMSVSFLMRCGGPASAGHAVFMGAGAYTTALLMIGGAALPFSLIAAMLAGGIAAVVIGSGVLLLRGLPGIIATFVAGLLVHQGALALLSYDGIAVSWKWSRDIELYVLSGFLVGTFLILRTLEHFWLGHKQTTAAALGLSAGQLERASYRHRLIAYSISGLFGGLAGGLYALAYLFIEPNVFSWNISLLVLAIALVVGTGMLSGAIVMAVICGLLWRLIGEVSSQSLYTSLLYGLPLVLIVLAVLIHVGPTQLRAVIARWGVRDRMP